VKFAINYSRVALDLRKQNRIQADLLKCPDWPDHWPEFAMAGPVYIHFRLMAGSRHMQSVDWDQIASLRNWSNTPFVNLHISPYLDWISNLVSEGKADAFAENIFNLAYQDVMLASRYFGAENVIVENVPYQDTVGLQARPAVEPELFSRLVAETGCGLLLDLAHARITASQLGIPEREYIQALPLTHLKELHITGLQEEDGLLVDHRPMREEDWLSVQWAFQKIRAGEWSEPWVMTFEYGGLGPGYQERTDAKVIEEQLNRFSLVWDDSSHSELSNISPNDND
jgi:uncharacterized protein